MTLQKTQIQNLIAEIDTILNKASPRLPWVVSGEINQQRQLLEKTRGYLISMQQMMEAPLSLDGETGGGVGATGQTPSASAQQVLQAVLQEMTYLRTQLVQPMRTEVDFLQQQRDQLLQEVKTLEIQQLQQSSLPSQPATDLMHELMERLQATLSEQIRQTLRRQEADSANAYLLQGAEDGTLMDAPRLSPADRLKQLEAMQGQSDQLLLKLDSTLRLVFESLQSSIESYQDSLAQGLDKMHDLGQQGEVIFTALINHLAQQLSQDASAHIEANRLTQEDQARLAAAQAEAAATFDNAMTDWPETVEEGLNLDDLDLDVELADEDITVLQLNEDITQFQLDDEDEDVTVVQVGDGSQAQQAGQVPVSPAQDAALLSLLDQSDDDETVIEVGAPKGLGNAQQNQDIDALYESLFGESAVTPAAEIPPDTGTADLAADTDLPSDTLDELSVDAFPETTAAEREPAVIADNPQSEELSSIDDSSDVVDVAPETVSELTATQSMTVDADGLSSPQIGDAVAEQSDVDAPAAMIEDGLTVSDDLEVEESTPTDLDDLLFAGNPAESSAIVVDDVGETDADEVSEIVDVASFFGETEIAPSLEDDTVQPPVDQIESLTDLLPENADASGNRLLSAAELLDALDTELTADPSDQSWSEEGFIPAPPEEQLLSDPSTSEETEAIDLDLDLDESALQALNEDLLSLEGLEQPAFESLGLQSESLSSELSLSALSNDDALEDIQSATDLPQTLAEAQSSEETLADSLTATDDDELTTSDSLEESLMELSNAPLDSLDSDVANRNLGESSPTDFDGTPLESTGEDGPLDLDLALGDLAGELPDEAEADEAIATIETLPFETPAANSIETADDSGVTPSFDEDLSDLVDGNFVEGLTLTPESETEAIVAPPESVQPPVQSEALTLENLPPETLTPETLGIESTETTWTLSNLVDEEPISDAAADMSTAAMDEMSDFLDDASIEEDIEAALAATESDESLGLFADQPEIDAEITNAIPELDNLLDLDVDLTPSPTENLLAVDETADLGMERSSEELFTEAASTEAIDEIADTKPDDATTDDVAELLDALATEETVAPSTSTESEGLTLQGLIESEGAGGLSQELGVEATTSPDDLPDLSIEGLDDSDFSLPDLDAADGDRPPTEASSDRQSEEGLSHLLDNLDLESFDPFGAEEASTTLDAGSRDDEGNDAAASPSESSGVESSELENEVALASTDVDFSLDTLVDNPLDLDIDIPVENADETEAFSLDSLDGNIDLGIEPIENADEGATFSSLDALDESVDMGIPLPEDGGDTEEFSLDSLEDRVDLDLTAAEERPVVESTGLDSIEPTLDDLEIDNISLDLEAGTEVEPEMATNISVENGDETRDDFALEGLEESIAPDLISSEVEGETVDFSLDSLAGNDDLALDIFPAEAADEAEAISVDSLEDNAGEFEIPPLEDAAEEASFSFDSLEDSLDLPLNIAETPESAHGEEALFSDSLATNLDLELDNLAENLGTEALIEVDGADEIATADTSEEDSDVQSLSLNALADNEALEVAPLQETDDDIGEFSLDSLEDGMNLGLSTPDTADEATGLDLDLLEDELALNIEGSALDDVDELTEPVIPDDVMADFSSDLELPEELAQELSTADAFSDPNSDDLLAELPDLALPDSEMLSSDPLGLDEVEQVSAPDVDLPDLGGEIEPPLANDLDVFDDASLAATEDLSVFDNTSGSETADTNVSESATVELARSEVSETAQAVGPDVDTLDNTLSNFDVVPDFPLSDSETIASEQLADALPEPDVDSASLADIDLADIDLADIDIEPLADLSTPPIEAVEFETLESELGGSDSPADSALPGKTAETDPALHQLVVEESQQAVPPAADLRTPLSEALEAPPLDLLEDLDSVLSDVDTELVPDASEIAPGTKDVRETVSSTVPPIPPQVIDLNHAWFLGIDFGTTGVSMVLLDRVTDDVYPVYWHNLTGEAGAPERIFRLPAIVDLIPTQDQSAYSWQIQTSGLAAIQTAWQRNTQPSTAIASEGLLMRQLKPLLKVGIPYQPNNSDAWQPTVQWSTEHQIPLQLVQAGLTDLLQNLQSADACAALGLEVMPLQTALQQLAGVIIGYPPNWPDTYCFNLREAVLATGLVTQPDQIFFVEDAIATVLSGLPNPAKTSSEESTTPSRQQALYNSNWERGTIVICAGATVTELALVDLPSQLSTLAYSDFALKTLNYAGDAIDQDIICQLLLPSGNRQTGNSRTDNTSPFNRYASGGWSWQPTIPAISEADWDSLQLDELTLPRPGEPDLIRRHQLQQHLEGSLLGQSLLEAARYLKLILQHQGQFQLELGNQRWTIRRRELESQIFLPYIQRVNRHINMLLTQTGLAAQGINQVVCTGGSASLPAFARWLRQKFPNATIIQDTYPSDRPASCSRVAYGLVNLARYPNVLDVNRQQYNDYFLLRELLRHLPDMPLPVSGVMHRLEQHGLNTQACQMHLMALLEGHLPPGLVPTEADRVLLNTSSSEVEIYRALTSQPLFSKQGGQIYVPNPDQAARLSQHLETLLQGKQQRLEEPLGAHLGASVVLS